LQVLQEDELHEVQPEPDETCLSTPLIPKVENFFLMFLELQPGHVTFGLAPATSFSNSFLQSRQVYSNIGIMFPLIETLFYYNRKLPYF
jgi:hypothetical protein